MRFRSVGGSTSLGEWTTNEHGVSTHSVVSFAHWGWEGVATADAVVCAEIITAEIEQNTMVGITCERGSPEINVGLFEFEYEINFTLFKVIIDWVEARTGPDGFDPPDREEAKQILAELDASAAIMRLALASPAVKALSLD